MRQQVNLWQPAQRTRGVALDGATALVVIAAVAGLLAAAWAFGAWTHARERAEVVRLQAQEQAAQAQVEALRAKFPERAPSKSLAAEVDRLGRQVDQRKRLHAALNGSGIGNTDGFSAHLEGLARQHVEGAWLERITLAGGGRSIALSGRAVAAELVPVYVGRLGQEPPFQGNQFSQLRIRQSEADPLLVEFGVGTPGATLPEPAAQPLAERGGRVR